MCGFAGVLLKKEQLNSGMKDDLFSMGNEIVHRGPDSFGIWVDDEARIGLVHRRLAIQDLSPNGHQPMASSSGRYVIAFNGEIYNFLELKHELETLGVIIKGGSDTEVMLASFEAWGIERSLKKFVGMFAFALWDRTNRLLVLARDRLGEKPLYYGWQGNALVFGSELKPLKKFNGWIGEINRGAICLLLRHNYIPAPYSIYKGIYKLLPGAYITVSWDDPGNNIKASSYWSIKSVIEHGQSNQMNCSGDDVETGLEALLTESVRQKMVSDVPVGAFLSGGIDSSLITSLMQKVSRDSVKTFTIGFEEKGFNEAEHAKEVARYLGTQHTELYVTPKDAIEVIPKLVKYYDEPFADSSQIPTYLVSQLAREKVTVVLSGDGGDEFFCGYTRYFSIFRDWQATERVPLWLRRILSGSVVQIPEMILDPVLEALVNAFTDRSGYSAAEKVRRRLGGYSSVSLQSFYRHSISYWTEPETVVLGAKEPLVFLSEQGNCSAPIHPYSQMMCLDANSYLPDDILVKVDRATMAHSLEGRMPILDHRVIEYASRIPVEMNIKDGVGKQLLRRILYKYVPQTLVDRPKTGFAVPISEWLRGPLHQWADSLLNEERLEREGFFVAAAIRKKWLEHTSGKNDWAFYLWGVLAFQSWLEHENLSHG